MLMNSSQSVFTKMYEQAQAAQGLVEPVEPEGYDEAYRKWSYENLPIILG